MKILKAFEWKSFGSSQKAKHDWDTLLDGQIHQLEHGKDFTSKPNTFLTLARNAAKARGLKLRTAKVEGGVVVQAFSEGEASPVPAEKTEKKRGKS